MSSRSMKQLLSVAHFLLEKEGMGDGMDGSKVAGGNLAESEY